MRIFGRGLYRRLRYYRALVITTLAITAFAIREHADERPTTGRLLERQHGSV